MNELEIGVAVSLAAGILSFLSPCVLPLVPSYLSFVSGIGIEELESGDGDMKRVAFMHSLFFVLGFSLIFMALGASVTFIGQLLREYQVWIARVGGLLFVFPAGLYLLGFRPFKGMARERRIHLRDKPLGYLGSTVVGLTFGAGWTPCIGPILGGILTFAATRQTMTDGLILLGFYSLGLAVPFLLSALAMSWFLSTFDRFRRWIPWVERAGGLLLILVALLLISGRFTALAGWFTQFTPSFILERI